MNTTCEHCNKIFSTKSNLVKHQTKTRKCLTIQNKVPETVYSCIYCKKEFVSKDAYNSHLTRHAIDPLFQSEERNRVQNEKYTHEIETIKNKYETRISEIEREANSRHNICLERIKIFEDKHTNETKILEEKYRREIRTLEEKHRGEMQLLEMRHETKIVEIERGYMEIIFDLRSQCRESSRDGKSETVSDFDTFQLVPESAIEQKQPTNIVQSLKSVQIDPEIIIDQNNLLQIASEMINAGEVKTTLEFVSTFMFALDSEEQFPLNIEILVDRRVFDTKGNAKRALLKYFTENVDYKIINQNNFQSKIVSERENQDNEHIKNLVFQLRKARSEIKKQKTNDKIVSKTENKNQTEEHIENLAFQLRKARSEIKKEKTNDKIASETKDSHGGGNKETIMLTTECFKYLSQTAMNEVGRQTRLYYHDMEKILKKYIVFEYNNRIIFQNSEIKRINRNHNALLKKRTYFQFKTGPCMYLLSFTGKHKFGFSDDMNNVLPGERRMAPLLKVEYLVYSPDAYRLEQNMLLKHKLNLETPNHEIVIGLNTDMLIESTRRMIEIFNLEHQEEGNVSEYNDQI